MTNPRRRISAGTALLAVELGEQATVSLHMTGEPGGAALGPAEIAALFEAGMTTAEEEEPGAVPVGELEFADITFLVGELQVDPAIGRAAVTRGLEEAVKRWVQDYRRRRQAGHAGEEPPAPTAAADETPSDDAADEDDAAGETREVGPAVPDDNQPTVVALPITDAPEHLTELVDRVIEEGVHIVLERDGESVAVILPFAHYHAMRYRLAQFDAAWWGAWENGIWKPERYLASVRQIVPVST